MKNEHIIYSLDAALQPKVIALLNHLESLDRPFVPYSGRRDPIEQGKLWRSGRTRASVESAMKRLRAQGCEFLRACVAAAGPQNGRIVTNALPGFSEHNYGTAVDLYALTRDVVTGDLVVSWAENDYAILGVCAANVRLEWGGKWRSFPDRPHVQLPRKTPFNYLEAEAAMRKQYPLLVEQLDV